MGSLDAWNPAKNKNIKMSGIFDNVQSQLDRVIASEMAMLSPTQYQNFSAWTNAYPNQSKDFIMSAVKLGLKPDTPGIGKIASVDGLAQLKQDLLNTKNIKSALDKDKSLAADIRDVLYGGFKGTSRVLFAALRAPYEYVSTVGRDAYALATQKEKPSVGELISNLSPTGLFGETTQLGQLTSAFLANPTKVDTGSGFFVGEKSKVQKAQAKAMSAYGLINGKSFTLGRAAMKTVGSDPNSTQYKVMSGIIDATLNIALDPSIWIGPGAVTKIGKGGKALREAKTAAAAELQKESSRLAGATRLTKEERKLIKERSGLAKEVTRQADNKYLKAEQKYQQAQQARIEADFIAATKTFVSDSKNAANLAGPEGVALDNRAIGEFIFERMNTGKQQESVDALSKLSADFYNTQGAFSGGVFFDELPQAGALSFATRGNDEFVARYFGAKAPKLLDLADDTSAMSQKAATQELKRRTELLNRIKAAADDGTLPASTREVFDKLRNENTEISRVVTSMLEDMVAAPLADTIRAVSVFKDQRAIATVVEMIEDIYKVDGFSNIRSIFGETGGVVLTNVDNVAARKVKISEVLAESAEPGMATQAMLKVDSVIEKAEQGLAKSRKALEDSQAEQLAMKQRLEDIKVLRDYASKDPEVLKMMLNDPDNIGIAKVMDLDMQIGDTRYAKEFFASEVGLTDSLFGGLSGDGVKAMKYLFGKRFLAVAEVVAKEKNTMRLDRLFGRKLDVEIVDELAQAETVEGVLSVFLRHLASPESDPQIARGLLFRTEMALNSKNPLIKLSEPVNQKAVAFVEKAEKALTNIYVRSTILPLNDLDRLTRGLNDWFTSAKVSQDLVDDVINKVIREKDYTARSKIIMDGMRMMQQELVKTVGKGDEQLAKVLDDALKISGKDQAIIRNYSVANLAQGTDPKLMFANGEELAMTGANYAHQFLDDVIRLPDTRPIVDAINTYNKNVPLYGKAQAIGVAANQLGDYWRTAQLAFRVSYTMRNIGEMQLRMFFSGHESIFNHPIQFMAMAMANPKGTKMQALASRIGKYQNDIFGSNFKDDVSEKLVAEALDEYMQFMKRGISAGDPRTAFVGKIYEVVGNTHESYYKGLALTLMRFHKDDLMPLVARARTPELQEDLINYLTTKKQGLDILEKIHRGARTSREVSGAKVSDFDKIILKDASKPFSKDNINPENLRTYLFDINSTASYEYAIQAIGGKGPKAEYIREMLANGKVTVTQGNKTTDVVIPDYAKLKNIVEMDDLEIGFKSQLASFFRREDMPDSTVLLSRTKRFADAEPKMLTKAVDWFFDLNAKFENLAAFGPEFRMAYWDHVGRYANMLDTDDLKKLQASAVKTLAPLRKNGKAWGRKHQTIKIIEKELKKRGDNYVHEGGVTLDQLNSMASKAGAKYTKELFYDASQQLQSAQAMRLIFPFIQAQFNTIRKWGQLYVSNPINFYKLGRAYNSLTKEGTSAIYDITGTKYDEGQGFIYEDEFGEKRFRYPIAGSFLGALVGKNADASQALQLSAPVQSLNLAFGNVNPGIPGIGPAGQFIYQASGKSAAFGPVWDTLRGIVIPFGVSDSPVESLLPAWLRKTFLYAINDQKTVERGVKDWASYLASTGEYGDNPLADDDARTRLFKDAEGMSRGIGLLTALFQSIAPATPSQEVFAKIPKDKKLDFASMTMLYNAWDQISRKHPGDYFAAVHEFSTEFGERNLLAILGGSTRTVTGTKDAWTFLNMNPEAADKYATKNGDIVPFFFPGGEGATAYYAWQKITGRREALSTEELAAAAEELIYKMAKSQISETQAAMGYSDVWYANEINNLNKRFGGAAPASSINVGTDNERIANVAEALQDDAFKLSPVYEDTLKFYNSYSNAIELLKQARVTAEPDLGSSHWYASQLRGQLQELADSIMLENPAFAPMFYRVFAGTMKAKD